MHRTSTQLPTADHPALAGARAEVREKSILAAGADPAGLSTGVLAAWKGLAGRQEMARLSAGLPAPEREVFTRLRQQITPGNLPLLASLLADGRLREPDLAVAPRDALHHLGELLTVTVPRGLDRGALVDLAIRRLAGVRPSAGEGFTREAALIDRAETLALVAARARRGMPPAAGAEMIRLLVERIAALGEVAPTPRRAERAVEAAAPTASWKHALARFLGTGRLAS